MSWHALAGRRGLGFCTDERKAKKYPYGAKEPSGHLPQKFNTRLPNNASEDPWEKKHKLKWLRANFVCLKKILSIPVHCKKFCVILTQFIIEKRSTHFYL